MKNAIVIECAGTIKRDRTSFGHQFSVDMETDEFEEKKILRQYENKKVMVRMEIEEVPNGTEK